MRADWPALLPAHRADGAEQPVGAPARVASLPLGPGLELAVVADDAGGCYPVPLVTAGAEARRAVAGDGAAEALLRLLADSPDLPDLTDGFAVTRWNPASGVGERAISVDQTNESVVVGESAVVKWVVRAEPGPHPAPSLIGLLEEGGFTGMPRPFGALEWQGRLLAIAVAFVPGALDGWDWAVDLVREAAASGRHDDIVAAGRHTGDLVGAFHRALAPSARRATEAESDAWRAGALADLDRALEVSDSPVLARHADAARAALAAMPSANVVMRVHGDLHVGQVLRSPHRYVLTDFDGNPVVAPHLRRDPQPAALDVAGMAQSLTHVGLVVRRHHPDLDAAAVDAATRHLRSAFLEAYRAATVSTGLLDERLVRPFALRQVCREFVYAATHLPRWAYVPEAALPLLLDPDQEDPRGR